ncbi:hypothetical protein [Thiomonas sp.]|uniref:hypothetical protein n=1 Tax=Thiomonas sp. TaxID=2047785 RepID=UPI00262F031E|nr:hypothetical protein [Thiomonas sp.]
MKPHTIRTALLGSAALGSALLAACGGGGTSLTPYTPYVPSDQLVACTPGTDVIGTWKTLSNNKTLIPDSASVAFFSYNQPSVNTAGMVVFRGRARDSAGGTEGGSSGGTGGTGGMTRGVFAMDACAGRPTMYTVADTNFLVPDPNNAGAQFTEFPSIPRIDIDSAVIATRGQSTPVWTLADGTKLGTSGVYATMPKTLGTAVNLLGGVADFSYMQVPGATTPGTRFDQFPGSPSVAQGHFVVFKGNYTDGTTSRTGVYYRDVNVANAPVQRIADSTTLIPGTSTPFGSTAPPSAAGSKVVFVGLDNEDAPTAGGLYLANLAPDPVLSPLVTIGNTQVPDSTGAPLPPMAGASSPPTFSQIGEGLGFDGRYVSFWGAWDTQDPQQMRTVARNCPTDGNKDLINACNGQYPGGVANLPEPVNQGIFVYDTTTGKLWMAARAGATEQFQDLLFWTFSGAPATTGSSGSSGPTDAEPPRWRASAFTAVDGARGVLFKGVLTPPAGGTGPSSGIYGSVLSGNGMGSVFKLVAVGDDMSAIDPTAPAGSTVSAVSMEREALRGGWLAISVSSLNPAQESWAGVYATYFPGAWHVQQPDPLVMGVLGLGS